MKILLLMFVPLCEILIGQFVFRQVNEVEIEKSWRSLGNTAMIRLPNLPGAYQNKSLLEEKLTTGSPVQITLWYMDEQAHVEFTGYVSRVKAVIPFEIECEDEIYWFKRTPIKKTWKEKTNLKEVVRYLVDEVNAKHKASITLSGNLPTVKFNDGFVIQSGNTAATALQKLKEEYGLVSYFREKELFTGLSEQQNFGRVKYSLAWNVIENDLIFQRAEDTIIKIKAVGFTQDNKKITPKKEVGDADGELRTVHYYNVTTEAELLKLAENDLQKYKYEGFKGSLTGFLIPFAEPLMTCDLIDPTYNGSRSGLYQTDSVKISFGQNGARRTVELGRKLSV